MFQYRQVLVRLRQGDSERDIARARLMGRPKAKALRLLAMEHGWLDPATPLPEDAVLAAALGPAKRPASTISTLEPHRDWVTRWVREGISGVVIHAALHREQGYRGSYSSVYRFLRSVQSAQPPEASAPMFFAPAEAAQVEQILRTVRRTPEVMVKVSGSASSAKKAIAHMAYVGRKGELAIETDDGQQLSGRSAAQSLSDAWQLGIDELVGRNPYKGASGRRAGKLTHHIVLSMPAQTPPERLLEAAKGFARDEFALQHRYAMALHTD